MVRAALRLTAQRREQHPRLERHHNRRKPGTGVFGWTRARGTFLEPHFLGEYIAAILPLATGAALATRGRLRVVFTATAVALGLALVATSSAPDFVVLLLGVLVASTAFTIGRRWFAAAAALGLVTATLTVLTPLALLSPRVVAAATGRSQTDVTTTLHFRTDAWSRVLDIWRQRPALGFGPGQSSVQLAAATDVPKASRPAPTSLQSAQGVWAASLVDTGVAGLACWIVLLSSAGFFAVRAVTRSPSAMTWAVAAAAAAAIAGAQVTGDRLELRVWLVLGCGVAVAQTHPIQAGRRPRIAEKPPKATGQNPAERPGEKAVVARTDHVDVQIVESGEHRVCLVPRVPLRARALEVVREHVLERQPRPSAQERAPCQSPKATHDTRL